MKEFGRQFFPKVAYVSFYNNKRMSDVFEMDFDIQRILMNLNIETGTPLQEHDTPVHLRRNTSEIPGLSVHPEFHPE